MANADYTQRVKNIRSVFHSGRTKSLEWRKSQLEALLRLIEDNSEAMCEALKKDLNKSHMESMGMEISFSRNEIVHTLNHIDEWTKPEPVKKNLVTMMDTCFIKPEPYGIVLVMGAWNYPIQLTLLPMIGAIAAGNCVILKPSELSENTALLIAKLIPQYLDNDCISVICGGIPETTALLRERFDYIFYTGGTNVGKIVMEAASKFVTPVTLELGGKSPCYVDKSSDLNIVAKRVVWGKFANCGQTCVAPDYIICNSEIQEQLASKMKEAIQQFWGSDPQKSADLGRMVNGRHFHRVKRFLNEGEIYTGGNVDEKENYIEPTILLNVKPTDEVMTEEIFGPVLPVITIDKIEDVIEFINSREKPLAAYLFSKDKSLTDKWVSEVTSGTMCINDTIMQGALETLPFGGVGYSGQGAYHGKFTFDTYSHKKSVMIKKQAMESLNNLRYPPYSKKKEEWMNFLLTKGRKRSGIMSFLPLIVIGAALAFLLKALGLQNYLPNRLTN